MAFGVGDSLKVRVSAQTQDFVRGMERAKEKTEQLGDQATQTAASLTALSGSASTATGNIYLLNGAISLTITQAAILGGLLASIAGALAAVAGAAALVVGSGLAAYGEKLSNQNQKQLKQVNKRIRNLKELKRQTGSLTRQQQKRLRQLEKQRKELKEATTIIGALKRELRPIGAAFRDAFTAAGERFIPLVKDGLNALPGIIRELGRAFKNAELGALLALMRAIGRFIAQNAAPSLRTFLGIANNVSKALFAINRALRPFVQIIGKRLKPAIQEVLPTLRSLWKAWKSVDQIVVPVMKTIVRILTTALNAALKTLFNTLQGISKLLRGDFSGAFKKFKEALASALGGAIDIVAILIDGFAAAARWLGEKGVRVVKDTFSALPGILADLIGAGGGFVKKGFWLVWQWLKGDPGALKRIASSIIANISSAIVTAFKQGLAKAAKLAIPGNKGGSGAIPIGPVLPVGAVPGMATGGFVEEGGLARIHEGERIVPASQVTDRGKVQASGSGEMTVNVHVEGDTEVIKEVTAQAIHDEARRTRERSGSQNRP